MAIAIRRVIASVVIVVTPGPRAWVIQDDIGTQPTVEIGRQYGGLHPGPTGVVMIVAPLIVVIHANGGVIPVIVNIGFWPWIIGAGPHHAPS